MPELEPLSYAKAFATLSQKQLVVNHSSHLRAADADATTACGRLQTHSGAVLPGDIFIAYAGVATDSHRFLGDAIARGAGLVIVEKAPPAELGHRVPWLQVSSGRVARSWLAAAAAGHPEERLNFYGITGTNGKTSSVWILRSLLEACGVKTLSAGTLGLYWGDALYPSSHTTPDPEVLFAFLAKVAREGGDTVAMEVSSHAIAQSKLVALSFAGAAFTSFSRDHLDFHPTMEDYWQCKWQLFSELLQTTGRAVLHASLDPWRGSAAPLPQKDLWRYGACGQGEPGTKEAPAALQLQTLTPLDHGTYLRFHYQGQSFEGAIPYVGAYNCENFLSAWLLASHRLGEGIASSYWQQLQQVPGRLELVTRESAPGPRVFVDYAHTPDALAKALGVLRPLCRGKLWLVFGCGGDRDQGKRPLMGQIAATHADCAVLTSDNPRSEDPKAIMAAVAAGFGPLPRLICQENRAEAIALAIAAAGQEDVILIAGKGHEDYQIIGSEKFPFDDRLVASQFLRAKR